MESRSSRTILRKLFIGFILAWVCKVIIATENLEYDTTQYIEDKLRETKLIIAKHYSRELQPVVIQSYDVQWDKLWSESVGKDRAITVNLFDRIFLIEKNRIMAISVHVASLNETSRLSEVAVINQEQQIKFVRSIVWKNTLYVLICHETGYCILYTGSDNLKLTSKQTFRYSGLPTDAAFFTQANRLYLVVADNAGKYPVPSTIYHWSGTYMDVISEVIITGAVSVATFKHRQSTIMIFARSGKPRIVSEVFEFKNDGIERIQFLPTNRAASVRHYEFEDKDFVLVTDEIGATFVYWWDGSELLRWLELPEIEASDLLEIVRADGDTFFVVARNNRIYLYKMYGMSENCSMIDLKILEKDQQVVDMAAWADGSVITLVLITINSENLYRIEPWELYIKKATQAEQQLHDADPSHCFSTLNELLRTRMSALNKVTSSWPALLSPSENETFSGTVSVPDMILESGSIDEINVHFEGDVVQPRTVLENADQIEREIDELLAATKSLLHSGGKNILSGNVLVKGDAIFDELHIDSLNVDYLNDADVRLHDVISAKDDQEFSAALRGNNITVQNLEIQSLCGIPFEYWAVKFDTNKTTIDLLNENVKLSNDTIYVQSNLSMNGLNTNTLNDVDVDKLFGELFLINRSQEIKGNLSYKGFLRLGNFSTDSLNGISSELLMTRTTNQSLPKFYAKSMAITNLYADFINGVPVAEAARKSRENVIKGPVRLMNLNVTDELIVETDVEIPEIRPKQIYDDVVIHGDVRIKAVDLEPNASLILSETSINTKTIFDTLWTKSSDQVVKGNISLLGGLTIDRLDTEYLNGRKEEEFLYTTSKEIPESFTNLYFNDFQVNGSLATGSDKLFEANGNSLTIHKGLHLRQLSANNLLTDAFNGVSIERIMRGSEKLVFNESIYFPTIRATRDITVENLELEFLNNRSVTEYVRNVIYLDEDHRVNSIETSKLSVESVNIERLNDQDMEKFVELPVKILSALSNLTIDGDLIVDGDLKVSNINAFDAEEYAKSVAMQNVAFNAHENIDSLVAENLTVKLLHGFDPEDFTKHENQYSFDLETLINRTLSKSKAQVIPGQFSFNKIVATNVDAELINNRNTSDLLWIDEPINFPGNVTFTILHVMNDVETEYLNGANVREFYENLLITPVKNVTNLRVNGTIRWKNARPQPNSLSHLFENTVKNKANQTIRGAVTFKNDVSVAEVSGDFDEAEEIREIVSDAVIDDEETVEIYGEKIFEKDLTVDTLYVEEDVDIAQINDTNILDFNASVIRKDSAGHLSGTVTFLDNVKIEKLIESTNNSSSVLNGVALATDTLQNVVFEHLTVQGNVYAKFLDRVDFDKFVANRVTRTGNHQVFADVQFNGLVEVIGDAKVDTINGIHTSDLVLNDTKETQIITGSKTFRDNLVVEGNVEAPFVNEMDLPAEYSKGILRDENIEIFGNLIFEENVDDLLNVTVSGSVNEMELSKLVENFDRTSNETFEFLKESDRKTEELIARSTKVTESLKNRFFYLEAEENLTIHVANVNKVVAVNVGETMILNLYGDEAGTFCGLPEDCPCPFQYQAELTANSCDVRRTNGSGTIVRNFHEPNDIFGFNVLSNVVSSNERCTRGDIEDEFVTVSWMRIAAAKDGSVIGRAKDGAVKVQGFLQDADVFTFNDKAYVILAIYYDPRLKTHRTNSLIYEMDFKKDELSLHQNISTDGAWAIETFRIGNRAVFLLLGCFGESAESMLLVLDHSSAKFVELRTFRSRSRYVKHLSQGNHHFLFLDDPATNILNVFYYDEKYNNFYAYQSLFHESQINGIECFYADEFGNSDAFVIITTESGQIFIYEYTFAGKFQLHTQYSIDGIQTMAPFYFMAHRYVFAGSNTNSTIIRIVEQGPH